jgi:ATP-binding cassette, subfamily B, bacterial
VSGEPPKPSKPGEPGESGESGESPESARPRRAGLGAGFALIRRYVRRHPRPFALAVSGASLFAVATVATSWALGKMTDDVVRPAFEERRDIDPTRVVVIFIVVGALRVLFALIRRTNAGFTRTENLATWQNKIVRQLLDQPISFFRRRPTGELLAATETDADAAVNVLSPLPFGCGVIVLLISAAIWMLSIDPVLGLVALILLPCLAISNHFFSQRTEGPVEEIQEGLSRLSSSVHELVDGFGVIKALGLESRQRAKVRADIDRVAAAKQKALRIRAVFEGFQDVLLPTVNVALLLLGAYRVQASALTIGQLAGVLGLFNLLVWPLRLLGFVLADLPRSVVAAARVDDVLNVSVPVKPRQLQPRDTKHAYELRDVRVVHDDGRVALDDVSLDIELGSTVAVVGSTGSGKSTLLEVLVGLEPPSSGELRMRDSKAAMVFQEAFVLSGSVQDNLTLGQDRKPDHVEEGLRVAEAAFVDGLPQARKSMIGERGITLSGGQRQRLALARAISCDAPVLLLDDTTSALDAQTEERVLAGLASLHRQQTVILVAARPSSISFADRIIVLERGRVVGDGTHAELMADNLQYRQLFDALADA